MAINLDNNQMQNLCTRLINEKILTTKNDQLKKNVIKNDKIKM